MKRIILFAGLAATLLACNNNSGNDAGNNAGNDDTASHAAQHSATSSSSNENLPKVEMYQMMHEMHNIKPTGNNDIDFATMMIIHHNGAVQMSKVELNKGSDLELKKFAQKVIDDQNEEITQMQKITSASRKDASPNSPDFQKALGNSMGAMMGEETNNYNSVDKNYAAQMVPHHKSAVDMAKAYVSYGKNSALLTLCKQIINNQTNEINWLKEWLDKNK